MSPPFQPKTFRYLPDHPPTHTCCWAVACVRGTVTGAPTFARCLATKPKPAEAPPAGAAPAAPASCPGLLASARPRSSVSARCPRDRLSGLGAAAVAAFAVAEPSMVAVGGLDCPDGCCGGAAVAERGSCEGASKVDWRLCRASRAEAMGAVKAVGAGCAGAAGALPAQHEYRVSAQVLRSDCGLHAAERLPEHEARVPLSKSDYGGNSCGVCRA